MYIYVHARKCICIVIPYKPTASLNAYIFSLSGNRNLPLPKHFFHCKHWYIFVANRKRPISFHCRLRTHISVPKPLELISFRCKHHSPSLANPQNEYFFRCKGQTLLSIRCKHINPSIASPNHLIITIRCTNFSKLLQLPSPYYASLLPRNPVIKRKPARRIPPQVNTRSPALWATGTRWQSGWWRQRLVSSLTADSRR